MQDLQDINDPLDVISEGRVLPALGQNRALVHGN